MEATEKEKVVNYIHNNFNIDITTLRLIESIYNFVIYKKLCIEDFCEILNGAFIDITPEELKKII